jgi:hypothetical protein
MDRVNVLVWCAIIGGCVAFWLAAIALTTWVN